MAIARPIQVVLVKTGVTTWDASGLCSGRADLPLCPEGRQAVESCAGQLEHLSASGVLTAPDAASAETAALIAARIGGRVRPIEGWAEPGMGLWEGQSEEQLMERFPKAYRQWKQDPASVSIPESESLDDAQVRITEEFARVVGRRRLGADRATVAVLRPMALGLVLCWLDARPLSELWTVIAGVESCRKLEIERAHLKRPILDVVSSVGGDRAAGA